MELVDALTGTYTLGTLDGTAAGAWWALRLVAEGMTVGEAFLEIDARLAHRSEIMETFYPVVSMVEEQREGSNVQRKN